MSQDFVPSPKRAMAVEPSVCSNSIHGLGNTFNHHVREIVDSIGEQAPGFTCDTLLVKCRTCGNIVGAVPVIPHAKYFYSRQRIKQLLEPLTASHGG